jgi:hypothetical protein
MLRWYVCVALQHSSIAVERASQVKAHAPLAGRHGRGHRPRAHRQLQNTERGRRVCNRWTRRQLLAGRHGRGHSTRAHRQLQDIEEGNKMCDRGAVGPWCGVVNLELIEGRCKGSLAAAGRHITAVYEHRTQAERQLQKRGGEGVCATGQRCVSCSWATWEGAPTAGSQAAAGSYAV